MVFINWKRLLCLHSAVCKLEFKFDFKRFFSIKFTLIYSRPSTGFLDFTKFMITHLFSLVCVNH